VWDRLFFLLLSAKKSALTGREAFFASPLSLLLNLSLQPIDETSHKLTTLSQQSILSPVALSPVSLCAMAFLKFALSEVFSLSELANRLDVDVRALQLVCLLNEECKTTDCNLLQVSNNNKYCLLCSQSRFPKLLNRRGEKTNNSRGHGLFGPQLNELI
jgi:hypothetical protein